MVTQILRQTKEHVPFCVIASFFHVAKGTIQQYWKRAQHGLSANGRRSVLSNEVMTQMFQFITAEFEHGRSVCYDGIIDWLYAQRYFSVLPDTLRHVIRRTDAFKTVREIPIESGRGHPRPFLSPSTGN
jgi:hypothetical protein